MKISNLNNPQFYKPEKEFINYWYNELVDWWGDKVSHNTKRIVFHEEKHWYVKFKSDENEQKRDYLAYLLGREWTNIAEVKPLTEADIINLSNIGIFTPNWATSSNTYLVRMGQDYSTSQLANKNIDEAVANELVFSIWIRRRDTHAANHVYINKIPVFYDHETAFLGEPKLSELDIFFQAGIDAGYASRWRVKVIDKNTQITTMQTRKTSWLRNIANHYIEDLEKFKDAVYNAVKYIKAQDSTYWFHTALKAGFKEKEANQISTFLEKNSNEMDFATDKLFEIILESSPLIWINSFKYCNKKIRNTLIKTLRFSK